MVVATATRYVSREYEATIDLPIDRRLLPLLGKYFVMEVSVAEGCLTTDAGTIPEVPHIAGDFRLVGSCNSPIETLAPSSESRPISRPWIEHADPADGRSPELGPRPHRAAFRKLQLNPAEGGEAGVNGPAEVFRVRRLAHRAAQDVSSFSTIERPFSAARTRKRRFSPSSRFLMVMLAMARSSVRSFTRS